MEIPTRAELEQRLHAFIADHLDHLEAENPEGFNLGVLAQTWEVLTPDPDHVSLTRVDAGYTPGWDVDYYFSHYCTDHRWWIMEAIFGKAHEYYSYPPPSASSDEGEEGEDE